MTNEQKLTCPVCQHGPGSTYSGLDKTRNLVCGQCRCKWGWDWTVGNKRIDEWPSCKSGRLHAIRKGQGVTSKYSTKFHNSITYKRNPSSIIDMSMKKVR